MKTRLNLATRPFRNRTLPWTITVIIALVSLFALVVTVRKSFQTTAQAQAIEKDVGRLKKETDDLANRTRQIKSDFTAEQFQDLKSAHALVDRKSFSWSRLFGDLEVALPGGVKVSRITVKGVNAMDDRTEADLELVVISKSSTTITDMISTMEREGVFRAALVSQNTQRGRGETGAEYELSVHYTPRSGAPIAFSEEGNRAVDTAGKTNRTKR